MKHRISLVFVALLAMVAIGAQPVAETPVDSPLEVQFAVMAGPTGFSSVALNENGGRITEDIQIAMQVFPSPNEVVARLANGELDFACLPSNLAANIYNKGVKIKLAAVIGNGMLSVVSSDGSVQGVDDLLGKTVHVPGAGSTPDQMAQLLLREAGLEAGVDVILDYSVASPAQLAQLTIAGKVSLVMLPQPFVSMILNGSKRAKEVVDVQELYEELSGVANYPMSVMVVSEQFAEKHPEALEDILKAYEDSVAWVNAEPQAAGKAIEEAGIMKAALATPSIPFCNLVFVPSQEAKEEVQAYYRFLHSFSPAAIGGAVPADNLYL